jgi:SAM-dependent methyltransferase
MWDKRYSGPGYAYGTRENDYLAEVADRIPVGRVLCLGEGEGRNAVFLAERGYRVTAVDASTVGLEKAERLAAERGVIIRTEVADLAAFDLDVSCWQGIVSIFCHLPPVVRADVHRRCVAGLAPGGAFVLEAFTPRQLAYGTGGPSREELLVNLATLRRELRDLRLEIAREVERDVVEGRYHTGRAAVVQLLGCKDGA